MQPAENLDAAIEIDIATLVESLAEPRFVTLAASDLQIALPCEVEANASVQEVFVAVLHFIASALGPIKGVHSLQPEIAALLRVKAHLPKRPPRSKAGAVVERAIHLEISSVVLDLVRP